MDLVISEREHSAEGGRISDAAEELVLAARSYVACLQGIKAHGYGSAASTAVIDARCTKVGRAADALAAAVDGLSAKTGGHLDTIASIDRAIL